MAAYVIGEAEVLHPEKMSGYGQLVAKAIAAYGGKYLARGAKPLVLEGGPAHNILIIEFPDVETAHRWYGSPEYAEAKQLREGNTNLRLLIVPDFIKAP
jgi:uncharacterized protein (DUF1330 family)